MGDAREGMADVRGNGKAPVRVLVLGGAAWPTVTGSA